MKKAILLCTVLLAVSIAVGAIIAAGADAKVKVLFLRGGGHDWKNNPPIITANGHGKEAWLNPHFERLVVRGAYWAAGKKV